MPAEDVLVGRVTIPPDQILANLTTIYESALAVIALLARGNDQDLESALICNRSRQLRAAAAGRNLWVAWSASAHSSGNLALFNDRGRAAAKSSAPVESTASTGFEASKRATPTVQLS